MVVVVVGTTVRSSGAGCCWAVPRAEWCCTHTLSLLAKRGALEDWRDTLRFPSRNGSPPPPSRWTTVLGVPLGRWAVLCWAAGQRSVGGRSRYTQNGASCSPCTLYVAVEWTASVVVSGRLRDVPQGAGSRGGGGGGGSRRERYQYRAVLCPSYRSQRTPSRRQVPRHGAVGWPSLLARKLERRPGSECSRGPRTTSCMLRGVGGLIGLAGLQRSGG